MHARARRSSIRFCVKDGISWNFAKDDNAKTSDATTTIDFVSRALNFHFTFARLLNATPAGLATCTSHQIELSVVRSMHLSTKLVRSSRILRCAMVVADYVNDNVIVPDKMLDHLYVRF